MSVYPLTEHAGTKKRIYDDVSSSRDNLQLFRSGCYPSVHQLKQRTSQHYNNSSSK